MRIKNNTLEKILRQISVVALVLIYKAGFTSSYKIKDYKSLSLYYLSTGLIDTLIIEEVPIEVSLKHFIKDNPKKKELISLEIGQLGEYGSLSNDFEGYHSLESLDISTGVCTVDWQLFFSSVSNLKSLNINIRFSSIGSLLEEASKLRTLEYLSVSYIDKEDISFNNYGFKNLIIFQANGRFKTIPIELFKCPRLKHVSLGDSIEYIDESLLRQIEGHQINFSIKGGNFPVDLVDKSRSDYKYTHLGRFYPLESFDKRKKRCVGKRRHL